MFSVEAPGMILSQISLKRSCGQLLGEKLAARDPVWDGEGWECDRVACLRILLR